MMNKSLNVIKEIYKPYKYTILGKIIILESTSGTFVVKEISKNIEKIYSYLKSRNFDNFPLIVDDSRSNLVVFEYVNDTVYPKEQRAIDLVKLVGNLHKKTSFYKDVTQDKFKEIYDAILSNINYLSELYDNYFDTFYKDIYLSPSKYLFMQNYSKIKANLSFCKSELDSYYDLVKTKNNTRVCVNHGNLSLDHFIRNSKDYLISWDNYCYDSPVLDLVKLYKKEFFNINFNNLLKTYFNIYSFTKDEEKLFFILISLSDEIKFLDNELISTQNIRKILDYIYKTEELIRPYYLENQKEE